MLNHFPRYHLLMSMGESVRKGIRSISETFRIANRGLFTSFLVTMYAKGIGVPKFIIALIIKSRPFALFEVNQVSQANINKIQGISTAGVHGASSNYKPAVPIKVMRRILLVLPTFNSQNLNRRAIISDTSFLLSRYGLLVSECEFQNIKSMATSFDSTLAEWILIDSEYSLAELHEIFTEIAKIRKFYSIKVAMVVYDLWRRRDLDIISSSLGEVDFFLHMDESAVNKNFFSIRDRFIFWPIAQSTSHLLDRTEGIRKPTLFFSGRIMSDRLYIANEIIKSIRGTRFSVDFAFSDASRFPLDESSYRKKLQRSEISLSLSQRRMDHWIIPGRSLEILLSGSLLLQQEGPNESPLSKFLTPYQHYIPFSSISELRAAIKVCSENPEEVKALSSQGRSKSMELVDSLIQKSPLMQ